jgi:hypothetical protein
MRDQAIMQQDVLLHFGFICADLLSSSRAFLLSTPMENSANASSRAFLLSTPFFLLSTFMENSEATPQKSYKMQQIRKLVCLDPFFVKILNRLSVSLSADLCIHSY